MTIVRDLSKFKPAASREIHPVILSGGVGTRLWPLSRAAFPKQLHSLTSDRTLLQQTVLRGLSDSSFAPPIIVCNDDHRFLIDEQLAEIEVTPRAILLEPLPRNTGPAVAIAALWLMANDSDALMLVQPSDHVIGSVDALHSAVLKAAAAAQAGKLVTFGIKATRPETGYGYIQAGHALEGSDGVYAVERFVEKPNEQTASAFVKSGLFCWNSGIFLLSARHYLAELERLHPAMLDACVKAVKGGTHDPRVVRMDAEAFEKAPALSIDRAVMEHTRHAAVVPIDVSWSDIGSWRMLRDINERDEQGNVVQGDVVLDRVQNSYVRSERPLVVAMGLDDVVIVATDDAILVAKSEYAADVTKIVERLNEHNRTEPLQHTKIHRPWGYYQSVDAGDRYQVKRIMVKPGAQLSLQKHFHRSEHWVVVRGTALVQRGEESMLVRENESVYIPIGMEHRLKNPGKLPLHLIEVQSGAYLGEDDIVRIADSYGRS